MRINGITLPVRFRFTHDTGKDYRHYFEATLFGIPVVESESRDILMGRAFLKAHGELLQRTECQSRREPGTVGRGSLVPLLWVTDTRPLGAVDKYTALLYVPYERGRKTSSCASTLKQV